MTASGVFISYRHDDSQSAAGRIADNLERHFGKAQIFRDVETLQPGVDFVNAIDSALASCAVVLAVIGRRWMGAHSTQNRLKATNDWIRIELATALKRNIRVIPLLVEDATLPAEEDLPDDLKPLLRRHALTLSDGRWDYDMQQLTTTLESIGLRPLAQAPSPQPAVPAAKSSPIVKTLAWIGGIVVALIVLAMMVEQPNTTTPAATQPSLPVATQPAQSTRIVSGMPASACGCWGYAVAGYSTVNPQCSSGYQYVQACSGQCPAGGTPWQTICQ